jgi:rRNA-processing protein FCF1
MGRKLREEFIVDTSAFISIESIQLLKKVHTHFSSLTTDSVILELKNFAKHNDTLGEVAKRILASKKMIRVCNVVIKEQIGHIEKTDNDLYNLAKQEASPVVTDDHRFAHHVKDKITVYFSTFFLIALVVIGDVSKQKALTYLEKLRSARRWRDNIIYTVSKNALEKM